MNLLFASILSPSVTGQHISQLWRSPTITLSWGGHCAHDSAERLLFFSNMIVGMKEELSVPEEKEKKNSSGGETSYSWYRKWEWCQRRAWEQSAQRSHSTHTHKRGVVKPAGPDMLLCACTCVNVCVCVCVSVIRGLKMETEDVGPSLSVCLHSV